MDKKTADLLVKIAPRIPLFQGLGSGLLEDLVNCGRLISVENGDVLIEESDKADSFYILLKGEASVEKSVGGNIVHIAKLGGGECFGEMCLIEPGHGRSARIRAMMSCLVVKFYLASLKLYPGLTSELTLNVARILSDRLRKVNVNLASLSVDINHDNIVTDSPSKEQGENESHDSSTDLFMKKEHDLDPTHSESPQEEKSK